MPKPSSTQLEQMRRRLPDDPELAAPLVGALLRFSLEMVHERILAALASAGFADLNHAHLKVFRHPPPDGERLTTLASRANVTKQAMNYLVGQLEDLGYLYRHEGGAAATRVISLTDRGWAVAALQRKTVRGIERDWAARVGKERFAVFMDVLHQIAAR